jgi:hypothetical protein
MLRKFQNSISITFQTKQRVNLTTNIRVEDKLCEESIQFIILNQGLLIET